MSKSFECRHAGVPCRARFTGESNEEVLGKAVEHAREKHGVDLTQSRTLSRYAQSLVRDEGDRGEAAAASSGAGRLRK